MTVGPISAASLSQYVLAPSGSTQLQQPLQTLPESLTSGDPIWQRSASVPEKVYGISGSLNVLA